MHIFYFIKKIKKQPSALMSNEAKIQITLLGVCVCVCGFGLGALEIPYYEAAIPRS